VTHRFAPLSRRRWLAGVMTTWPCLGCAPALAQPQPAAPPDAARWAALAARMREQALGWGDQPYGAVLVLDGVLVGEGPSRVVQRGDPNAHAEREAIADAQRRLRRLRLDGSVLYSTSRPCSACEAAAAAAGVARMIHGVALHDAGPPRASVPR
jgi:tRNA(Arg) A34 adenosine deaminase TadA